MRAEIWGVFGTFLSVSAQARPGPDLVAPTAPAPVATASTYLASPEFMAPGRWARIMALDWNAEHGPLPMLKGRRRYAPVIAPGR